MCANDFSWSSQVSHFVVLRPMPAMSISTRGLCQSTPIEVGTRPSVLLAKRLTSQPFTPEISVAGIRVVAVMPSS